MRDQLQFDSLLFDCGILTYWAAMGQVFTLVEHGALSKSFVVKAVEAGAGVMGLTLPLTFAGNVFETAKRKFTRWRAYEKSEFEEIDSLRNYQKDLLDRLPHFLALDIARNLLINDQHALFLYDSYEKQAQQTLGGHSEWLRELIGTLNRGLRIIASREPLRWPGTSWTDVLTEIVVDALPEADCRELLSKETDAQGNVIDAIISSSHCIPFFVEALISVYETLRDERGFVDIHLLPETQADVTSRLIDHLPPLARELILTLATIQFFDEPQFRLLLRGVTYSSINCDVQ